MNTPNDVMRTADNDGTDAPREAVQADAEPILRMQAAGASALNGLNEDDAVAVRGYN